MKLKQAILIGLIWVYSDVTQSADLLDVWQGVGQHDPEAYAALSAKLAGSEKRKQSLSLWLPNVNVVGSSGKMNSSSDVTGANFTAPAPLGMSNGVGFNTSIKDGISNTWTVQARQPIFSQERLAHSKQLNLGADAADVEWKIANNELMLRTVQRYFEVVLLTKKLTLFKSEFAAIKIETTKAQEKFRIGELPIIDSQEALAKEQELIAQIIITGNELQMARRILSDASLIPEADLILFSPKEKLLTFNASTEAEWVQKARISNPLINLMNVKLNIAQQEVKSKSITASTSLDLVAQAAQQKLVGSGDFGSASNNTLQQMVGIQLTIPLFTSGYATSKEVEAIKLEEKARYDLENTQFKVQQSVQASWLTLASGLSRINALTANLVATNLKLESTKLAVEIGDRTTLDLINATNAKTLSEINLLQAKIDYLMNQLNLYALTGELDIDKLILINSQIEQ
jgi:outer membrane protein